MNSTKGKLRKQFHLHLTALFLCDLAQPQRMLRVGAGFQVLFSEQNPMSPASLQMCPTPGSPGSARMFDRSHRRGQSRGTWGGV